MNKEFKIIYNDNPIFVGSSIVGEYVAVRDANHNILPIIALDKESGTITIEDRDVKSGDELYISRKDVSIISQLDDGGTLPYMRQQLAKLYNNSINFKYIDTIDETPNTEDTMSLGGYRLDIGDKQYRYINYRYYVSDVKIRKLSTILNLGMYNTAGKPLVVTNGVKYIYITVNDRYYNSLTLIGDDKIIPAIGGVTRIPDTNVYFKCYKYDNVRNILNIFKEVEA